MQKREMMYKYIIFHHTDLEMRHLDIKKDVKNKFDVSLSTLLSRDDLLTLDCFKDVAEHYITPMDELGVWDSLQEDTSDNSGHRPSIPFETIFSALLE